MTSEISKTISTCTIWLATAMIMTFGVFQKNGDIMFFIVVTAIIIGGAAGATTVIWKPNPNSSSPPPPA
jgi:hypothetical protein